jgi:hypothetical protein
MRPLHLTAEKVSFGVYTFRGVVELGAGRLDHTNHATEWVSEDAETPN